MNEAWVLKDGKAPKIARQCHSKKVFNTIFFDLDSEGICYGNHQERASQESTTTTTAETVFFRNRTDVTSGIHGIKFSS